MIHPDFTAAAERGAKRKKLRRAGHCDGVFEFEKRGVDVVACRRYKQIVTKAICERCKGDPELKQRLFATYLQGMKERPGKCTHRGPDVRSHTIKCCGLPEETTVQVFHCGFHDKEMADPDCWICEHYKSQKPPAAAIPSLGRVVFLKAKDYRMAGTNRITQRLRAAGYDVTELDVALRPSFDQVIGRIGAEKPVAIVRWEEQGNLLKNRRWARVCAWCYENNVAPLSVDYGLFDHYSTLMIDCYLPDGSSAIGEDLPSMANVVNWDKVHPRLGKYRQKVLREYARAARQRRLVEGDYVVVFLQFSAGLSRLRVKPAADMGKWAERVYQEFKKAGVRVAFKCSPQGIKERPPGIPDDVPWFTHKSYQNVNLRLLRHAKWAVMNCSSVSNLFILCDVPATATGRSWFVAAPGVFYEPSSWPEITREPKIDHAARAKWTNWWLAHQGYGSEMVSRFQYALEVFQAARTAAGNRPKAEERPKQKRRKWRRQKAARVEPLEAEPSPCFLAPVSSDLRPFENGHCTPDSAVRFRAVILNDTRAEAGGRHMGCQLNYGVFREMVLNRGIEIVREVPVGRTDRGRKFDMALLEEADILIVHGEGSLHHERNKRVNGLLDCMEHAKKQGMQVWVSNAEAFGLNGELERLAMADYIAVRDVGSWGELARARIGAELAADCIFNLDPLNLPREGILLAVSGLVKPHEGIVEAYAQALGLRIVHGNYFYPIYDDGETDGVLEAFAKAKFVVSSSFHGCVLATLNAVPFLPMAARTPKTAVAAAEAMGPHAKHVNRPEYVKEHYFDIVATMRSRLPWLKERVQRNLPAFFDSPILDSELIT